MSSIGLNGSQPWPPGGASQSWMSQPYDAYEGRPRWEPDLELDPGIYARPEAEWHGDPGIAMEPDEWSGDPGIYVTPAQPSPLHQFSLEQAPVVEPRTDTRTEGLEFGEHVAHGARSMVLPGLVAGGVGGILSASRAPTHKGLVFGGVAARNAIGSVVAGATMGAIVGATSPAREDDLSARYAVAGGLVGAASGAAMPGSLTRGTSAAIGAGTHALMGWFIGRGADARELQAQLDDVPLGPPFAPAAEPDTLSA